ncbi:MAG: hypothetical protein QS98_C0005G0078 [archaeon GW2011_AR3]|nr:MAG: hypothetical protein QS98_C0005G0078 [archaeon GW2011_AR3]MBS3109417.1 hypothetical protein [Candidatus Woesearchaeota archaeon]
MSARKTAGKLSILFILGVLALSFIAIVSMDAAALGISVNVETEYAPNITRQFNICFRNSKNIPDEIMVTVEGPLKDYITLDFEPRFVLQPLETVCQSYYAHMPAEMKQAGRVATHIVATEIPEESDNGGFNFNIVVSVMHRHIWNVPYPGKYFDFTFDSFNAREGEPARFVLEGISRGTEMVKKVSGYAEIFDAISGKMVGSVQFTEAVYVNPLDKVKLKASWDTKGQKPGAYMVKAYFDYDEKSEYYERFFQIGELRVDVVNYTKTAYNDSINKFEIEVLSNWNDPVTDLYAEVTVKRGTYEYHFTTPVTPVKPFGSAVIRSFWETKGTDVGMHDIEIELLYSNATSITTGQLEVVPKPEEKPAPVNTTTLLIVIFIIMAILNAWWLMRNRGRKEQAENKQVA